ncbi:MAG: pilus assembly protein PilP [Magnetococcales bacterium]|nr:pilus assembly protein PilP [Magnetococcales bacterium]
MKRLVLLLLCAGTTALALAEDAPKKSEYVYKATGSRDPFKPPIEVEKKLAETNNTPEPVKPLRVKEPLEDFQLDSLKLVAILLTSDGNDSAAMVQDPQGKGHLIRKGYYLGSKEGQVIDIQDGVITIQEPPNSKNGDPKNITIRLHEKKAP